MSRLYLPLLALALGLGACDSATPSSSAGAVAPSALAGTHQAKGVAAVHRITESASVAVDGDIVLLEIQGQTVELRAGEAYVIGQALARVGHETLPGELVEVLPMPDKCEPPPPGVGVTAIGGALFGKCPPPPPPGFWEPGLLDKVLDGTVRVVEAPETAWTPIPGGFTAPY